MNTEVSRLALPANQECQGALASGLVLVASHRCTENLPMTQILLGT